MRADRRTTAFLITLMLLTSSTLPTAALADEPLEPVRVFILLGQSNMLGAGRVAGDKDGTLEFAVRRKKLYPYLLAENGSWAVRDDVRNVRVMGSGLGASRVFHNEFMTVKGRRIGPELGIGHKLGDALGAPVMILKSCIGNRSLGWDLLPPGSEGFDFDVKGQRYRYAAYKQSPLRWPKGSEPNKIGWYAGMQLDGDISRAKQVLANLETYYPGARGHRVAGFFWWQGDKDRYDPGHAAMYERNLVQLIKMLRQLFDAPDAPFVCATLGQTQKGAGGNEGLILRAKLAVASGKYPAFEGNVATVYTHLLSKGGSSNGHYDGNAETYMNVGEAMGAAMVELLKKQAARSLRIRRTNK